ncbi:Gfo/Idh/MocA family oxidoreductase [Phycisphaeraceae bacterium D3-23]
MIIVDSALKQREQGGKPIRVGIVGTGWMARGIVHQLLTPIQGIRLVAVYNRNAQRARDLLNEAGVTSVAEVASTKALEEAVNNGKLAIADDPMQLCEAGNIDVLMECTGHPEFGAQVAVASIENGKHTILVNAELDATVGPILKHKADKAGVVISNVDGDEPGVAMNLLRFVETLGYRPVAAGNIKGFIDQYRNPDTQKGFADSVNQGPKMITSFADGTKLSMETCILANAAGFGVAKRAMHGHNCEHVMDLPGYLEGETDALLERGIVDYVLGAKPGNGAFVVGYNDKPVKQEYMRYFKMGDGPLYVFYTPYHLPQLQAAVTIGRVALFGDAAVTPIGPPMCDVVAIAKRDLKQGDTLDGIGGFDAYGVIENAAQARQEDLLPMSLSEGCRIRRDVPIDTALTYADIELPADRLVDALRAEQNALFFPAIVQV